MIGAGSTAPAKTPTLIKPNSGSYGDYGVDPHKAASPKYNYNYTPQTAGERQKLLEHMQTMQKNQNGLAKTAMTWNGGLQSGKLVAETLSKTLDSVFAHVANMKQLNVYNNYLSKQHDIARRSIGLESKKLDVQKEMHNDQLRFQLKVAQHQKETSVTVAAIQEKGKTKRVQALAALRTVYGRGKPVSPFQRSMS